MAYLIDANVLVRLANTDDALFGVAELAVPRLHRGGEALHVTAPGATGEGLRSPVFLVLIGSIITTSETACGSKTLAT